MSDSFVWDDRTWEQVWERTLDHVERHHIAMSVLRRRLPDTPLERRVARELAQRWARHAVFLAVVYGLWTLFWAAIGWDMTGRYGAATARLPMVCAGIGGAAVTVCLAFCRSMAALRRG
jgi:hypothetical protein